MWLIYALLIWGLIDIFSGAGLIIWSIITLFRVLFFYKDPMAERPRRKYWRVGED